MPQWITDLDKKIDEGFEYTGLPQLTGGAAGYAGRGFDALFGTNIAPTVEHIGRDLPRMVAEAALTVPLAATGAGAGGSAAIWMNRLRKLGQAAGYADAAVSGYGDTGSYGGAAINALGLGLGNKLFFEAGRAVPLLGETVDIGAKGAALGDRLSGFVPKEINPAAALDLTTPNILARGAEPALDARTTMQRLMSTGGRIGADVGGGVALNEAQRQATMSVGDNAMSWDDPSRNPLTAENLIGNLMNSVPNAIGAASAYKARFRPDQINKLKAWQDNRIEANRLDAANRIGHEWEGPITPQAWQATFGTMDGAPAFRGQDQVPVEDYFGMQNEEYGKVLKDQDVIRKQMSEMTAEGVLGKTLSAHYDILRSKQMLGEDTESSRQEIHNILTGDGTGLSSPEGISFLKTRLQDLDASVRQLPPNTPDDLMRHIDRVNAEIDLVNSNERGISSVLVGQLAKKGLIEHVTPEELKSFQAAELEKTGDVEHAYRVALQQTMNRITREVPAALKRYKELPPDTTLTPWEAQQAANKSQRKADLVDNAYITALGKVPPEVKDELFARAIAVRSRPEYRLKGTRQGTEVSWRKKVIAASQAPDPLTAFRELVAKDEQQNYIYQPSGGTIRVSEGGTPSKEVSFQTDERSGVENLSAPEEDGYQRALIEEGQMRGSQEFSDTAKAAAEQGFVDETPTGRSLDVPVEDQGAVAKSTEELIAKSQQILKVLPTLTPDQLYKVAGPAFAMKPRTTVIEGQTISTVPRDPNANYRKNLLPTALMAALEDLSNPQGTGLGPNGEKFLTEWRKTRAERSDSPKKELNKALKRFFGEETPVNFANPVEGVSPYQQRLAYIMERLADPKTTGLVSNDPRMKADYGRTTIPETDPTVSSAMSALPPKATPPPENLPPGQVRYNEQNIFKDTQAPGKFVENVYDTFRARFDNYLGDLGYAGSIRDMYTEAAVAIAQTMPEKMADFYRIVNEAGGPTGLATHFQGRAKIGVKMYENTRPDQRAALEFLHTLAHEVSHIDTFITKGLIDAPDAFSERRRMHKDHLDALAVVMAPEQRSYMLTTLRDALYPKGYIGDVREEAPNQKLPYGTLDPEEFTAQINATIVPSLLFGKDWQKRSALDVLDYTPTEVAEFAQGTFRSISDILGAVQEVAGSLDTLPFRKLSTSAAFGAIVESAKYASKLRDSQKSLAQARTLTATLSQRSGNAMPLTTPAQWLNTAKDVKKTYAGTDLDLDPRALPGAGQSIQQASEFISSRAYDKVHKPGIWARWFYPYTNLMESMQKAGFDLARPMGELANGMESKITRLRSGFLEPFTLKNPDGSMAWAKDNELINRIQEGRTGPWRDVYNDLSAWQQEHKAQSMFIQDPKTGAITVNDQLPGAKEKWEKSRERLTAKDQQVVQSSMVAMDRTEQNKANALVKSLDESNTFRMAQILMGANRGMFHDQALATAQNLFAAYQQGNVQLITQLLPDPKLLRAMNGLLIGPEGLLTKTAEVTQLLQSRPGHRSEALTGDWILRYANKDGRIQYLSAQTEHKGLALMQKLKREGMTQKGEVINKRELNEFLEFDDPDTLLRKFTEIETKSWADFTNGLEKQFGPEFAAEMKGYLPGAQVAKELSLKGLNQFLAERKNNVDRSRYDYIDGTLASAGRLAASLAFKDTRMRKDLMLADPRARQFPSFQAIVNPHFDAMMTPTSQVAKEVKTFSTAMMMGGSLASAIINATQSVTSLVPIIMQHDKLRMGPVGAWKALYRAGADAVNISISDKWQGIAKGAAAIDPSKWSLEQSKAMAYKWSIEDGGIDHGIIGQKDIVDNLFTLTDQKTAMNAKFGRGDYGPATLAEAVRSPIYVASQWSMKPFGWVEKMNNKVSLMAGVDQAYSQGLRGQELYEHAKLVKSLSTYGGGKANAIGFGQNFAASPFARSAFGIVNNLQQYGYGIVSTYAQLMKDSIGKSEGLSPLQRRQAQKAFGTMFATQLALSGALGLPFAAAGLAAIEKIFDIPANELVREGLASISDDDETGATIAETALNGLGNQMFGIDVSSRLGVSSLMGTSSYRGFNIADLTGPTGSIVGSAVKALGMFAQGEPMKGMTELVPNSFRNAVMMADTKLKYGDLGIRDSGDNLLYQPTPSQAAWYLTGFRPKEVSQKRQAQAMLTFADQRASKQRGRELDEQSRALLAGDPTQAMQYAYGLQYADPTVDPRTVLHSIVNRAVDSTTEKDLLATGSQASEGARQRIGQTFQPGVITRQSELQRSILGAQLGAQLGLPMRPESFQKAALVDALVGSQGMPRSQALRLAEMMQ